MFCMEIAFKELIGNETRIIRCYGFVYENHGLEYVTRMKGFES